MQHQRHGNDARDDAYRAWREQGHSDESERPRLDHEESHDERRYDERRYGTREGMRGEAQPGWMGSSRDGGERARMYPPRSGQPEWSARDPWSHGGWSYAPRSRSSWTTDAGFDRFDDIGERSRSALEGDRWGSRSSIEGGVGARRASSRSGGWVASSMGMTPARQEWRYGGYDEARVSHYGKGPKNYRRSDARIQEDVSELLREDQDIDATDVEVEVHQGIVSLKGEVGSRREKRWAEDCAEQVSGVQDVTNQLRVRSTTSAGDSHDERSRGTPVQVQANGQATQAQKAKT